MNEPKKVAEASELLQAINLESVQKVEVEKSDPTEARRFVNNFTPTVTLPSGAVVKFQGNITLVTDPKVIREIEKFGHKYNIVW